MKKVAHLALVGSLWAAFATWAPAQNYPTHKYTPKPKATPSATPSAAPSAAPTAAPTPTKPTGPLKMIKTDGHNKDSPIKIFDVQYRDEGYGTQLNAAVYTSCKIQNGSKTDELKKVTLIFSLVTGDGAAIPDAEWKTFIGSLKPGQQYSYNAPLFRNNMMIVLKPKVVVEHEEIPKKK